MLIQMDAEQALELRSFLQPHLGKLEDESTQHQGLLGTAEKTRL